MQETGVNRYSIIVANMIRLFFPIWFSYLLIMVAFRIGVKRRDRCAASLAVPQHTQSLSNEAGLLALFAGGSSMQPRTVCVQGC